MSSEPLSYDQWRRVLVAEPLPAVVVDLAAFDRNVAAIAAMLGEGEIRHTLRIATKSIRVPELTRRILAFGPPYQGLMCYAAAEAALLAELDFDDFLVAYPTVQASDLAALRSLHESGKTVRLVVDSRETIERIDAAMQGVANPFPLVLEVDMSLRPLGGRLHLGVRRSPVRRVEQVVELFDGARERKHVRLAGLMGYEAQVAGLGDRNPFKRMMNPVFRMVRKTSVRAVARLRGQIAAALKSRGHELEIFNGGGTGSVNLSVREPWLTEITAGSGFLCSHLFDYYSNFRLEPACFFALQANRRSDAGYITCQGGGYIASGEPGWDRLPVPYLPQGLSLVGTEGCGEVQTPLRGPAADTLDVGSPVLFRHAKAGELAERFNEYLLVADGQIVDRPKTYRGLGKSFY